MFLNFSLWFSPCLIAQVTGDRCHVYFADQSPEAAKALEKATEEISDQKELEKVAAKYLKILGEFTTVLGEEETTTKSYPLPTGKFVTVTVFYTDEMMAAEGVGSDSMLLSIAVADNRLESAQGAPECAQAELSTGQFAGKVRVKKVTKLKGKEYLIGLECECKALATNKD